MQEKGEKRRVFVIGVGMTKFIKPGQATAPDYPEMSKQAINRALRDAGIQYKEIDQVVAGYVAGDSAAGQRAVYEVGLSGVPIYNVNNNCSTGSTALYMAKKFIQGGLSECALAFGFEKMKKGSLGTFFNDRALPLEPFMNTLNDLRGITNTPFAPQLFGAAGREHMERYGTTQEQIAKIAEKNHRHSLNNPYSQFRAGHSLQKILESKEIYYPLTKLQCCPTSDGAGAAIVCSEEFVKAHGLEDQAVEIIAMSLTTDTESTFKSKSCMNIVGADMTKAAADQCYAEAGITPNDVQVVELHDCFAANELITYEGLGLCGKGEAGKFIDRGDNTYGGKYVVNPSGGLIAKGHPLGATGLAQCSELVWQLRGMAEKRQVPNAKIALQHNLGLGGACVVSIYKKYNDKPGRVRADQTSDPELLIRSETAYEETFQSVALFEKMAPLLEEHGADAVKKAQTTFGFDINKNGQTVFYTLNLKTGNGKLVRGKEGPLDVTFVLSDDTLMKLVAGKIKPQAAFLSKQVKIRGNIGQALKFSPDLLPRHARL